MNQISRTSFTILARLPLGVLVLLMLAGTGRAQSETVGTTPLGAAPGAPAGAYPLNGFDNINFFNGNLNFRLPLSGVAGRGGAAYKMMLPVEQKWIVERDDLDIPGPPSNQVVWYASSDWWTGIRPGYGPGVLEGRTGGTGSVRCNTVTPYHYTKTLTRLTFTAPDGTEFELRDQLTNGQPQSVAACQFTGFSRGTIFTTADGSAATFVSDTNIVDSLHTPGTGPLSGYLMMRDGTRYRFDGGLVSWLRDRNGNKLSFIYDSYSRVTTITDSLNRQITIAYDVNDLAPYGLCDKISYKGFGGTTRIVRVSKTSMGNVLRAGYTLQTDLQLFPELSGSAQTPFNPTVVSAVWLCDDAGSQKYQFFYNSYGELARVVLPTGGAIEYDYAAGLTDGAVSGYLTVGGVSHKYIYRRVIERRVYTDGSTLESKMTYSRPESSTANLGYVTVDQLDSNGGLLGRSNHYFYGSARASFNPGFGTQGPISYPAWTDGREYQTDIFDFDGTTVLRRTVNVWEQRALVSWWTGTADTAPPNDSRVNETDSTLAPSGANLVSKRTFSYDDTVPYNNQSDVYEYDFGVGAAGALVRRTHTDYITATSYTDAVSGAHIRSLPSQTSVYDSSGVERARASFEYDNYVVDVNHAGLIDYPSISGFDSAFSSSYTTRGNVTAATHYLLNSSGSVIGSISAYAQYDIAGNVVKTIDGRGYATTLEYADRFGAPDGEARSNTAPSELSSVGQSSYAFATLVTDALGHTNYAQFDYYLGRPVDSEDANGVVSSGFYNDALDRPTQIIRAANQGAGVKSQSAFSYDDSNRIVTTTSDLNGYGDNVLVSKVLYDGLGRTVRSFGYENQDTANPYLTTDTQYDTLGRTWRVSNPYRSTGPGSAVNPSGLWTTTGYDALSRVVAVTTPDSAVVLTSYSGNTVTVTDQAGKARKSVTDALGRLTNVDEDPNGVNYLTSYGYDVLDNLTTVSQGVQTRTFVYDSLKRLTSAANPENGTVSYGYDNNGNLTQKTDARGIVTTFGAYDALNRPTTRSYSDGTPGVTCSYDTATNGKGRLASVTSSVSTTNYTAYDALGRVTSSNQVTDGQAYTMSYSYNLAGGRTSVTYPSGRVIASEFDNAGRLAGVRDQSSGIYYAGAAATDATNRIQYAAQGAVSVMKLGNGLWEHTNFNNRLQAIEIGLGTSSTSTSVVGLTYDYGATNNNGNVQSTGYSGGGLSYTQTFGYDSLNRLTTSNENSGSSWSQTNGYDRYGNRWIDLGGGNQSLYFNTSNNRITNSGYGYDSAGNLTSDSLHTYAFDAENKIRNVDGETNVYGYDGDGNRVRKSFTSGDKLRMVYSGGQLIAEYDLSNGAFIKEYVYGATGLVATIEPSVGTKYVTADHLGSPRVITNSSGSVISRRDYLPFGEELGAGTGGRTTAQGYSAGDGVRQHFTQKERDNETGLDYSINRYYSSTQGRFTSPDPMNSSGIPMLPQTWNRYSYTINNPLLYTDPKGLIWGYHDHDGVRTFTWYWSEDDLKKAKDTPYTQSQYFSNAEGTDAVYLGSNNNARHISQQEYAAGVLDEYLRGSDSPLNDKEKGDLRRKFALRLKAEHPEWNFWAALFGGAAGGAAEGAAKGAEGAAASEIDAEALTLTKTVEEHLNDINKFGEKVRPYGDSRLVMKEIMEAGKGVPDPQGAPGFLRWDVPGAMNGSKGTWELVIDPKSSTVVHFLFKSTK